MVDWDVVDKRRAKGWDWDRVAADPKVDFHAEADAGDPGRALRAMYYQRRSKGRRGDEGGASGNGDAAGEVPLEVRRRRGFTTLAYFLVPFFGIWALLAFLIPSPVGTYLPAIPWLALALAISGIALGFALLVSSDRWGKAMRAAVVIGVVLGLTVSGAMAVVAVSQGCPSLTSSTSSEPGGWSKASNSVWSENGAPVFFFYGSIACPYCSASSWSMALALQRFGTLSGDVPGHSDNNPNDIPDTPEIILAGATLVSPYVALHVDESTNDNQITEPSTPSCTDQAFVSTYDSQGSIPFVVIGGQYVHVGTLVDPTQLRTTPGDGTSSPLTYAQVQGQINNQSGPAWNAISPQMYLMEAILCKMNGGQPTSVATDPNVASYLKQLS